jgi:hypothetical protein
MTLIADRRCQTCGKVTQAKISSDAAGVVFRCMKCGAIDRWRRNGPPAAPEPAAEKGGRR